MRRAHPWLLVLGLLIAACAGPTPAPTPADTPQPPTPRAAAAPVAVTTVATTTTPKPAASYISTPRAPAAPTIAPSATTSLASSATTTSSPPPAPAAPAASAPETALAEGKWLQSIGDCPGARRAYAELLAAKPLPAVASEANYLLAQCYLRDEAPAEASIALTEILEQAPDSDPWREPAQFLLGEAQSQLGLWAEAERSYQNYLPLAPEISSLVWQRVGAARRGRGDLVSATQAYTTALQTSPDWTNTVAIRRALADLALARSDYGQAVAQYDTLRAGSEKKAWIAEMEWLAGVALDQAGDQPASWQRWQRAVDADPSSAYAYRALAALVEAGAPVDEYQRGVVDYHSDLYALALDAFERLQTQDATGRQGNAWYWAGLSHLAMGQTDRGLAALGNLIAAYPDNPYWADAWLAKARAQDEAGRPEEAIATYRKLATQRPDAPQAAKALRQAVYLEEDLGRTEPAAQSYLALARRYPKADDAWRAFQSAALIYFRLGEWRKAGEIWDEMAKADLPSWTRPVAHFWLGRAQAAAGELAAARASWQLAQQSAPDTFHGLRAADWLAATAGDRAGKPANQPLSEPIALAGDPAAQQTEIAGWLASWAGEGTLDLSPAVVTDTDWQRGITLMTLGLRPEALGAWGRVQLRSAENPWAMAALAIAFRDAGAHRLSLLSAEEVVRLWGKGGMRQAPPALQQLAYPMPFERLVRGEAAKWKLDPRLLAAIMRQESRFETGATSIAGARGLMQVMPGTAAGIADRLGWQNFDPATSYWPYVNVALGANYVGTWLDHFSGSLTSALAAYNGGPGNAAVWRNWAPDDDDLMQGLINITETRVYVQTVWANYDAYRRLYRQ